MGSYVFLNRLVKNAFVFHFVHYKKVGQTPLEMEIDSRRIPLETVFSRKNIFKEPAGRRRGGGVGRRNFEEERFARILKTSREVATHAPLKRSAIACARRKYGNARNPASINFTARRCSHGIKFRPRYIPASRGRGGGGGGDTAFDTHMYRQKSVYPLNSAYSTFRYRRSLA